MAKDWRCDRGWRDGVGFRYFTKRTQDGLSFEYQIRPKGEGHTQPDEQEPWHPSLDAAWLYHNI